MTTHIFMQSIARARRSRQHGFMIKVMAKVRFKLGNRTVSASLVLFHRLHRDPVEIAPKLAHKLFRLDAARRSGYAARIMRRAELRARSRDVFLPQPSQRFVQRQFSPLARVKRLATR